MKVETSKLTGAALDWAVAKCEELKSEGAEAVASRSVRLGISPSLNWAVGGPIIEREQIALQYYQDGGHENGGEWLAQGIGDEADEEGFYSAVEQDGPTPLIAAMRCFATSKLGEEVEIPEDLFDILQASRVSAGN